MNGEDWRVEADVTDETTAWSVVRAIHERGAIDEARSALGELAAVSHNGSKIFAYTGSREHAMRAEQSIQQALADHGESAELTLSHWHPIEERWEPADKVLPQRSEDVEAEESALREQERSESRRIGTDEWQVHVEFPTRREAAEYAEALRSQEIKVARRWRFLLVNTPSEADGAELVRKIKSEAPASSQVFVEGSEAIVRAETLSANEHRLSPLTYL